MKKNLFSTAILIIGVLVFSSCPPDAPPPETILSSEALITGFTSAEIIGTADIDAGNKTVTVTVRPMDLSTFSPSITVSDKAELTPPASLSDGVPASYTVTAEDGTTAVWTVTVNVRYGITFLLDGTRISLYEGVMDSLNTTDNEDYGDGVPGIDIVTTTSDSIVFENVYDNNGGDPTTITFDFFTLNLTAVAAGSYSGQTAVFNDYSAGLETTFDTAITISEFGSEGENFRASFSGTEVDPPGTPKSITGGYAKLRVVVSYPF